MITNRWLLAAGILDGAAALLHLGCILGGPSWYRFFGAGERIARMAERSMWRPVPVTLGIALVLTLWAGAALSGAGVLPRLPLLKTALGIIAAIYLARAFALPWMLSAMSDRGSTFLWVSSAIVLVFGIVHLIGLIGLIRSD
ncbi:MAG: hypothetical protein ABIQ43_06420 [Sphingomonas sp.]